MGRKLVLYIACSVDGYIAGPDGDMSFLNAVQTEGEDYGYAEFIASVDTVIIGRKTYDWVMTQVEDFPHANKETYILSRSRTGSAGKLHYYNGGLKELVEDLKRSEGKTIFADGGAEVVTALLQQQLVDEMIVSVIPVLLGDGVKLFQAGIPNSILKLESSRQYDSGLLQLKYICNNSLSFCFES